MTASSQTVRIAVIGRTEMLLESARRLAGAGYAIALVGTWRASENYEAGVEQFEEFARDWDADFICSAALEKPDLLARIKAAEAQIAISMNWPTLLPKPVREMFPLGIFNAHPGDLPRYRGNACPNWAILNGESHVGVCIHLMSDELDAGDVAARRQLRLGDETDVSEVYGWLRITIPEMFKEVVDAAAAGTLTLEQQPRDPSQSLRCFPRKPEDSHIDWRKPVGDIHGLIRASTRPFAGAYTFLNDKCVRIWRAKPHVLAYPWLAVPGQVMLAIDGDPIIACGQGALRLLETSIEDEAGVTLDGRSQILSSLRNRLV